MKVHTLFTALKWFRIAVATVVFFLMAAFFAGVNNAVISTAQYLIDLQFMPLVLELCTGHLTAFIIIGFSSIVVLTLLLGRIYCSLLCPFGIMQDFLAWLPRVLRLRRKRYKPMPPLRSLRGSVLVLSALAIITGLMLPLLLLEPYSGFGRIATGILTPAFVKINNLIAALSGPEHFDWLYPRDMPSLSQTAVITASITLATIAAMSWFGGRIFCNSLCPVGAMLSLLSRFSLFRLVVGENSCSRCGLCAGKCKTGCIDAKKREIDFERCVMCLNCTSVCKFGSVKLALRYKTPSQGQTVVADLSRRDFLISTGATAAAMLTLPPLFKATVPATQPIMPPGASNLTHFQSRCTACHLCVSSCPGKVIKPATLEYGLAGFMQPRLSFKSHMCEYNCNVCSNVCPSGALLPLPLEEKQKTRIGIVEYRPQFCVVPNRKTDCGACAEHCPTQAVRMIPWKEGLNIPTTDPTICVGCGSCEYICPTQPKSIIVHGLKVQDEAKRPDTGSNATSQQLGNDFPF